MMNGGNYRLFSLALLGIHAALMSIVDGKNGQGLKYPDGREYKGPGAAAGDGKEANIRNASRSQPNADDVMRQAEDWLKQAVLANEGGAPMKDSTEDKQLYDLRTGKPVGPEGGQAGAGFQTFQARELSDDELIELNKHAKRKPIRREGVFAAYPDHDINAFNVGANLDLRARIAIDLLKSSYFHNSANVEYKPGKMGHMDADVAVHVACDVAESLIRHFEHKGWIGPVSRSGELSPELAKQAERMGRFGAAQQLSANQEAQDRANRVATLQQPGIVAGRA